MIDKIKRKRRCGCGCMEIVNPGRRFVRGHNLKGKDNHFYGLSGPDHPSYGTKLSPEHRKKISVAVSGANNPMYGVTIMSGESHHNWQGGKSNEPYCEGWYSEKFKRLIFERDNYRCQNPLCEGKSSRIVRHHIDGNKMNCELWNIITLCRSCSIIVEGRRKGGKSKKWWKQLLVSVMENKHG